jgi:hypothetical protein
LYEIKNEWLQKFHQIFFQIIYACVVGGPKFIGGVPGKS